MLELGQPMHAFDRDAVTGPITVRLAREGEKLTTLDGTTRKLSTDDLLITDDTGPIGLAAVMGGASTEIGDGTTTVLLEAAHWEPTGVARTARRHRLPSEAAKRFERGVDPEMTVVALARAAELLAEYGGARVVGGLVDVDTRGPRPTDPARRRQAGARRRACPTPPPRSSSCSSAVGCDVDAERQPARRSPRRPGGPTSPTRPTWSRRSSGSPATTTSRRCCRPRRPAAGSPTSSAAAAPSAGRWPRPATSRRRPTRSSGRRRWTRSACPTTTRAAQVVVVRNPLSEEEPALRTTLLPGLLATLARNLSRGQRDLALFEHGAVFPGGARTPAPLPGVDRRPDDETLAALLGAVPEQPWHVAVALAGNREPRGWWGAGPPGRLGRRRAGRPAGRRRLRGRADRARGGAGAVAPRPLRGAARRRPGRRPRRRAAPAGLRGAGAAGRAPRPWSWTSTRCRRRRCRSGRRSRASRRCCSTWRSWCRTTCPAAEVDGGAARRARGSCWSRCGCSTSTPARRCRPGRGRWPTR